MGPVERGSETQVEVSIDREQRGLWRLAGIHCLLLHRSGKTSIDHQSGSLQITNARKTDRRARGGYPQLGLIGR
jgi:hypothetical protein